MMKKATDSMVTDALIGDLRFSFFDTNTWIVQESDFAYTSSYGATCLNSTITSISQP